MVSLRANAELKHVGDSRRFMIPYMITELAAYLDRQDNFYFINVTTGGYGDHQRC